VAWPGAPELAPDRAARDLVEAIRAELAAAEPVRPCCRLAERAGLGVAADGRAPNAAVARLAVRLNQGPRGTFEWGSAADHCRFAYLRGRFLACGSLSLAGGRTHLEFVLDPTAATELAARLAEAGLPAALRLRRGSGVVTWKSGATITRFLQACGASASLLELEARLVARSLHGELNRALNAETANLARAVAAAARQVGVIEQLAAEGRLDREPARVRAVARARLDAPEATLTDLATSVGTSRSAVQRSLERLERLAMR